MSKSNKRSVFLAVFLLIVGAEIVIGVFVHDKFVRPYLGDVIVVAALCALVRVFVPDRAPWIPAAVFVFALAVELLQLARIPDLLGIENRVVRAILGSTFDPADVVCYAVGCAMAALVEFAIRRKRRKAQDRVSVD